MDLFYQEKYKLIESIYQMNPVRDDLHANNLLKDQKFLRSISL